MKIYAFTLLLRFVLTCGAAMNTTEQIGQTYSKSAHKVNIAERRRSNRQWEDRNWPM